MPPFDLQNEQEQVVIKRIGKILVWTAAVIGGLAVVLAVAVQLRWKRTFEAPYPEIHASNDPAVIAQGRYIAYGPGHCVGCHTDDSQKQLVHEGGQPPLTGGQEFRLPVGTFWTPNLTPDPETGIGRVTDGELARMIRYGVRPDGRAALPFMEFHDLSDEDLQALVSFLRAQPPVRRNVPDHQLKFVGKALMAFLIEPKGPSSPPRKSSPPPEPTVERGAYLANNVADCATCHTKRSKLDGSYLSAKFSGGMEMEMSGDPSKVLVTPNLTPDPKTGRITSWSEEQFVGRFGAGVGTPGTLMPWKQFQTMSTTDVQAIYRYLRSLPPVQHETGPLVQRRKKA
jgi:mono/diheme cytochrome c family protein